MLPLRIPILPLPPQSTSTATHAAWNQTFRFRGAGGHPWANGLDAAGTAGTTGTVLINNRSPTVWTKKGSQPMGVLRSANTLDAQHVRPLLELSLCGNHCSIESDFPSRGHFCSRHVLALTSVLFHAFSPSPFFTYQRLSLWLQQSAKIYERRIGHARDT